MNDEELTRHLDHISMRCIELQGGMDFDTFLERVISPSLRSMLTRCAEGGTTPQSMAMQYQVDEDMRLVLTLAYVKV